MASSLSLHNLAWAYFGQGKYEEIEELRGVEAAQEERRLGGCEG